MPASRSSLSQKRKLIALWLAGMAHKRALGQRRFWVHPTCQRNNMFGIPGSLLDDIRRDEDTFKDFLRVEIEEFDELHKILKNSITKMDTQLRPAIPSEKRLAICLRFLGTGNTFGDIGVQFGVGKTTLREIVLETCTEIWNTMQERYLSTPNAAEWMEFAEDFESEWNFPHCIGALDGKHISITAPPNSGPKFRNYKGFFSIVLQALVDAHYMFRVVDIGAYGSQNDAGVFSNSELEGNSMDLPLDGTLFGGDSTIPMPYVIVADDAFPLKTFIMKPYPGYILTNDQRIFNYRLSRARRVVENAFGILTQMFRVLQGRICMDPEHADTIVKSAVILHNFLQNNKDGVRSLITTANDNSQTTADIESHSCLRQPFAINFMTILSPIQGRLFDMVNIV